MNVIQVRKPSFAAVVDGLMALQMATAGSAEAQADGDETERRTEEVRDGE